MKILLATVGLAALLSSSAHAQYGVWRGGYYRAYAQVPYAAYRSYGFNRAYAQASPYAASGAYAQGSPYAAYGAYARAPYYNTPGVYDLYGRPSPYPFSVYDTRGVYVGSDPDPRVRSALARDSGRDD